MNFTLTSPAFAGQERGDRESAVQEDSVAQSAWAELLQRLEAAERRIGELEAPSAQLPELEEIFPWESGVLSLSDEEEAENNGSPTAILTGQVQIDVVNFNQSERNKQTIGELENAAGFRRARLGVFGEMYETTEYRIEFDFAGNGRPRFLDNWIAVKEVPVFQNVIVGHFFEPFSLERYTPNRFITFMERSVVDEFAPARNLGAMAFDHTDDERLTWAIGVFRSDSDVYGDAVNDSADWAGTAHVTWLPYYDAESDGRYLLHIGASYSFRAIGDKEVRFVKRPENQLQAFDKRGFPVFADTGPIASDQFQLIGTEMAWVYGPLSIQAEYVYCDVTRIDGGPDPNFWAAYAYVSYFLTGENRSYSPASILGRFREGIFQRITPNTNAFAGGQGGGLLAGPGAWEVAARVSHIDLNSQDIHGNRSTNLTVGINWYLNANTRLQFNYIRPHLFNTDFGNSTADVFATRFGFEF